MADHENAGGVSRRVVLGSLAGSAFGAALSGCSFAGSGDDDYKLKLVKAWERNVPLFSMTGAISGRTLIIAGNDNSDLATMSAFDLVTGKPKWKLRDGDKVSAPGVGMVNVETFGKSIEDSDRYETAFVAHHGILPVSYWNYWGDGASGVIGIDIDSGKPAWGRTVVPAQKHPRLGTFIRAVTTSAVVTTSISMSLRKPNATGDERETITDHQSPAVTTLDLKSGRKLWTRSGLLARAATDTYVLAQRSTDTAPIGLLGVRTGKAHGEVKEPTTVLSAAGDYAVLLPNKDSSQAYVLRLSTRKKIKLAAQDGEPRVLDADPALVVFDYTDPFISQTLPAGPVVRAGSGDLMDFQPWYSVHGYLWGSADAIAYASTRSGTQLSPEIGGGIAALHGDWLISVHGGTIEPNDFGIVAYRIKNR